MLDNKRLYDMRRGLAMLYTFNLIKKEKMKNELSMFDLSNIDEFASFANKSIKK